MESLWKETKKHELLPAKGDAPAFCVFLKHIGSKEDPFAWDRLQNEWQRTQEMLRIATRKELISTYGSAEEATSVLLEGLKDATFSIAVSYWKDRSEAYLDAYSKRVQDLILNGVVGGNEMLDEIFQAGGTRLLQTAAAAVVKFHELSPSQGEA